MTKSTVLSLTACLSSMLSLVGCSDKNASTPPCNQGDPTCTAGAGNSSVGGSTHGTTTSSSTSSSGGTSSAGGVTSTGGTTANATTGASTGGSSTATGGTTAKTSTTTGTTSTTGGKTSTGGTSASTSSSTAAGGKTSTGGTSANGGSSSAAGGKTGTGGTSSSVATGGTQATGGTSSAAGGSAATGGSSVTATGGTTSPTTDEGGKALAKPGDKTSNANDYLNLGYMRLINNNWGSKALSNCSAPMSVEVKSDSSLSWTFNRGNCNDDGSHPDYPELEFGVAPFGKTSSLRTTPAFSTTTLLPIQVKNIQNATASIGNFSIQLGGNNSWNLNIEFWLSKLDPLTNNDAQAYMEIMALWGWSAGAAEWKCNASGSVTSGSKSYNLCHQSDSWGTGGVWRFFQFQSSSGSSQNFSGTVDIKAFLDWFYNSSYGSGVSKDYYLTRIEIGSEIDDNTNGSCTLSNISFTINGTTQSPLLAK